MKMFVKLLLICVVLESVVCEHSREKRKTRFFSFDTLDDNIVVSLEFSIPFLAVPVKKATEGFGISNMGLPPINLNPGALALGGAIVLGSTIILPLILKNFAHHYPQQRYSRLVNTAEFEADRTLGFLNEILQNRNLNGCALRVACWSSQSSYSLEFMSIWDQVMSHKLISTMVNTTAVENAMAQGRKGQDCLTYTPCPLQENHIPGIMKNIVLLTKTYHLF